MIVIDNALLWYTFIVLCDYFICICYSKLFSNRRCLSPVEFCFGDLKLVLFLARTTAIYLYITDTSKSHFYFMLRMYGTRLVVLRIIVCNLTVPPFPLCTLYNKAMHMDLCKRFIANKVFIYLTTVSGRWTSRSKLQTAVTLHYNDIILQ